MTSALKRYSQVEPRERFLYTIGTPATGTLFTLPNGQRTGVIDIQNVTVDGALPAGMYKDLGYTVYVYDTNQVVGSDDSPIGPQVAILRLVQRVSSATTAATGAFTEGVRYPPVWIATWAAGGLSYTNAASTKVITLAPVVRTG